MNYPEKAYLYKRVVQAKLFIDDHFAEDIDLGNIADQACFSKFHFIRLFKSIYGDTPNHYLVRKRIEKAKLLLLEGKTILKAGLEVGFESPTSFAGAFKKLSGISPSGFQKREMSRRMSMMEFPLRHIPGCFAERSGWLKTQF